MRRTRGSTLVVGVALAGSVGVGCTSGVTTPTAAVASPSAASGPVAVQLIEGKITSDPATASPGPVTFAIKNVGMAVHEFVVIRTDLKADALPIAGDVVDESAVTVIDEVENLPLRATPTLDVDLGAGHYALICNIAEHYAAGMHTDFEVT
jgi:uncharacterized cupredoxin-like copper-binding protein